MKTINRPQAGNKALTLTKSVAHALGFLRTFAALKNGRQPHEEYPEFLHYRPY
jgi:hypothetical protein